MKKLLLGIPGLIAILGSTALAQSLVGTWQGTLAPPPGAPATAKELRIVMKVAATDGDTLKATLYSIDQGGQAVPGGALTVLGKAVKIPVTGIGGTWEGNLSSDGNTLTGTWTQGPAPIPLNLVRATAQTAWTIPEPPAKPKPMAANANPSFEVATIKPSRPDAPRGGYGFRGQDVTTTNVTVNWLIKLAWNVHVRQIAGGAAWLDSEKYDVVGRPDTPGQPSRDQMKLMIRKLLADRFQLRFRTEKRELPVYAMVVLKKGAKIAVSEEDPNDFPGLGFSQGPGVLALIGRNTTLDGVANALQSNILDKPVVNQTGLTGRYDFTLKFAPDQTQLANFGAGAPAPTADPDAPPNIFAAFEQQLGLKLESTRAVVDVMVIEKIARPSEN
jgi:uncharacterized protein (TIGR03435 family)